MSTMPPIPAQFWWLLVLCLLAFLGLWWVLLGSGRAARRRRLRMRIETLGYGGAEMQASLARQIPPLHDPTAPGPVRNPHYAIPWFLFVGDASANVPDLLAAASGPSSSQPATAASQAFWHWRRLPSMIAIDVHPALLGDPQSPRERGLWYRALLELAERRERLPLNGIVVCISASALLDAARAREAVARRLRTLVQEAAEHLRIQLPVYLVVTGLERLDGYDAVREALPAEVLAQALGSRLRNDAAPRVPADAQLDGLFGEIMQRMHALRMALFRSRESPAQRQAIHAFVEQVRSLRPGLRATADCVFGNGRGPRSPRWRGLYFTAAPSNGNGGAFAQDLFTRFLPTDQPLAHSRRPGAGNDGDFASTRI
jgi:type VI secretion system protein ImpL